MHMWSRHALAFIRTLWCLREHLVLVDVQEPFLLTALQLAARLCPGGPCQSLRERQHLAAQPKSAARASARELPHQSTEVGSQVNSPLFSRLLSLTVRESHPPGCLNRHSHVNNVMQGPEWHGAEAGLRCLAMRITPSPPAIQTVARATSVYSGCVCACRMSNSNCNGIRYPWQNVSMASCQRAHVCFGNQIWFKPKPTFVHLLGIPHAYQRTVR